jgi:DNA-binding transcriptional MerR regulator
MFTIGEFSKIAGLSVKTLRFYHEAGVLPPSAIDDQSGYRYYADDKIERARWISYLRGLEFSLDEIRELLRHEDDDVAMLEIVERRKSSLEAKIRHYRKAVRSLEQYLTEERRSSLMAQSHFEVVEKELDPLLVGGIRMKGKYSECGKAFSRIARSLGRQIAGKPLLLHYDTEFREDDADFEACFPLRRPAAADGISVRELAGGRSITLIHRGSYDQLGHSYARLLNHVHDRGYTVAVPTREVYLKGPGMILRGNPRRYLTEIQMLLARSALYGIAVAPIGRHAASASTRSNKARIFRVTGFAT